MSQSTSTLCPGYTHVSSFGPDEEYECGEDGDIEEEVSYVTLDLGSVEPTLVPSSSGYRIIVSPFQSLIYAFTLKKNLVRDRAWTVLTLSCSFPARYSRVSIKDCWEPSYFSRRTKVCS